MSSFCTEGVGFGLITADPNSSPPKYPLRGRATQMLSQAQPEQLSTLSLSLRFRVEEFKVVKNDTRTKIRSSDKRGLQRLGMFTTGRLR